MQMDVRAPMGTMFTVLGIALTGFGLFDPKESHSHGMNVKEFNVNLWWGLVILAFGIVMLLLAWHAGRTAKPPDVRPTRSKPD